MEIAGRRNRRPSVIRGEGGESIAISGDLSKTESPDTLVREVVSRFGRIDILVNNAGTIIRHPAEEYPLADWMTILQVNLTSVFQLSQLAAKDMMHRGQGGKIVNIASPLSFQGGIRVPAYAASKGGVAQCTKALANEWASKGINVNAIAPGYMRTENTRALQADELRNRCRSWSGFRQGDGENRKISRVLSYSCPAGPATILPVPSSTSMGDGWRVKRKQLARICKSPSHNRVCAFRVDSWYATHPPRRQQ